MYGAKRYIEDENVSENLYFDRPIWLSFEVGASSINKDYTKDKVHFIYISQMVLQFTNSGLPFNVSDVPSRMIFFNLTNTGTNVYSVDVKYFTLGPVLNILSSAVISISVQIQLVYLKDKTIRRKSGAI